MTPELKQKFEEMYSLSIRRGEDSTVVLEWIEQTLDKHADFLCAASDQKIDSLQKENERLKETILNSDTYNELVEAQSEITRLKEENKLARTSFDQVMTLLHQVHKSGYHPTGKLKDMIEEICIDLI